ALSVLVSDANFACPAEQVDRWTSARVPTYGYQFDDGSAPPIFTGPFYPIATHTSEIQYLLGQPHAQFPPPPTPTQQGRASRLRPAWTAFAAKGSPSTGAVPWPSFNAGSKVLSLHSPQPTVDTSFDADHHCGFWGVN